MRPTTAGFLPISEEGLSERKRWHRRTDMGIAVVTLVAVVLLDAWSALFAGLAAALMFGQGNVMRGVRVNSRGQVWIQRPHPKFVAAWNDQSATRTEHNTAESETPPA